MKACQLTEINVGTTKSTNSQLKKFIITNFNVILGLFFNHKKRKNTFAEGIYSISSVIQMRNLPYTKLNFKLKQNFDQAVTKN